MTLWISALIAVVGSGGLTAIIAKLMEKGKLSADASKVLADTAIVLVGPLKERINELGNQVDEMIAEIDECHSERDKLKVRVRELEDAVGVTPPAS